MSELPSCTPKKVIKALGKAGFVFVRQRGSHRLYQNQRYTVTIPFHNKDLKRPTLMSIIQQAGLTQEEFIKLL